MCNNDERFNIVNYAEWLTDFLETHNKIDTEDIKYSSNGFAPKDAAYIYNIDRFFTSIEEYANNNHLYPVRVDYGAYFYIMINEKMYKVGVDAGQGVSFYVKPNDDENVKNHIYLEDIVYNKKRPGVDNINDKLNNLKNLILELHEDNVPEESINRAVTEALLEVREKDAKQRIRNK